MASISKSGPDFGTFWTRIRSNALLIGVTLVLAAMILIPIFRLLINSFVKGHPALPEGWTLDNYATALGMDLFYDALVTTIGIAGVGTFITVAIAVLFAWLIERTDMPCRNLAWTLILVPMAVPGVLFALGWTLLLSPTIGVINAFIRDFVSIFGVEIVKGPINIYSVGGLIFLDGIRGITTVFLMVVGAFRMMDPSLEEAARVSKAGTIGTFFQVTLPALTPAILAAGMYSFISSMEAFEAPLAVGLPGNVFVLSTLIYFTTRIQAPLDYGLAAVFGVSYMLLMVFMLVWYRRAVKNTERFATITGKGFRPRIISIGKWRYAALGMFVLYFMMAVVAPFCILLYTSFLPSYRVPSAEAFSLFSWANYIEVFELDQVYDVIGNTLYLMVVAATVTMIMAFMVSWVIVRAPVRGRGFLDGLVFVPHAIPGIVIALALIMAFLSPPLRYTGLYGSMTVVIIGLIVAYISFATRLMNGAIMQVHKELEQAAYVSGASNMKTMFYITLPLLFPAFAAGWIWVAVHALRAFSIPIMLSNEDTLVFAVLLWDMWEDGTAPLASALGVLLILVLVPLTLLMRRFIQQMTSQQG